MCWLNHQSPAQSGAEHGLLILLGGPLNCIGYWTISILLLLWRFVNIVVFLCLHQITLLHPNIFFKSACLHERIYNYSYNHICFTLSRTLIFKECSFQIPQFSQKHGVYTTLFYVLLMHLAVHSVLPWCIFKFVMTFLISTLTLLIKLTSIKRLFLI